MARLHLLERDDALHFLARVGLALQERLEPHHGVEVARVVDADPTFLQGFTERAHVGIHDLDGFGRGDRTRLGELLLEADLRAMPILLPAFHALVLFRVVTDQPAGDSKTFSELPLRRIP